MKKKFKSATQNNNTAPYLSVDHLTIYSPSGREIIKDLSLSIQQGSKLAIIGAEGAGKSTIIKALAGVPLDGYDIRGEITRGRLGYLPQSLADDWGNLTPLEYMFYKTPSDLYETIEWEHYPDAIKAINEVYLPSDILEQERPLSSLSGGESIKLRIAKILKSSPEMLLLDEPTNYLDFSSIEWLENYISTSNMPIAYVSHDEMLIKNTANQILFMQYFAYKNESRYILSGQSYEDFVFAREEEFNRSESDSEKQKSEVKKLKRQYSDMEGRSRSKEEKGTTSDMGAKNSANKASAKAKNQLAQLKNKIEEESLHPDALKRDEEAKISFNENSEVRSKKGIDITIPRIGFNEEILAQNISLSARYQDRIIIIGKNGSGKSTLLKAIKNYIEKESAFKVGYIPQDFSELFPDSNVEAATFLDALNIDKTMNRTVLMRLGFDRLELTHKISQLSGGQKMKLLLAKTMLEGSSILLLDEPTTNLSPLSTPALNKALLDFPGTIIAVSHDRTFISDVGTMVVELTKNGLEERHFRVSQDVSVTKKPSI